MANAQGFACDCLSFRYGQRHAVELSAAERVAKAHGAASWRIVDVDLRGFGGSSLVGDGEVPKDRDAAHMASGIPSTYVPARNTVFLSFALALAEVTGARDLFFGANAIDYSGYPDCRPAFVDAFEKLANVATKEGGFRVHAPLIAMTKADIIRAGTKLGVDYAMTWSCYDPQHRGSSDATEATEATDARACGACDSCALRRRGFVDAGVPDPTRYLGGA